MDEPLSYQEILAAVAGELWAIQPEKLHAICAFLALRATGGEVSADDRELALALHGGQPEEFTVNGTAVIPIHGTIAERVSLLSESSGGTSAQRIGDRLQAALDDTKVRNVLLDINSPGGAARGMNELAGMIRQARRTKPITAIANRLAASAGYWLASQANEVVAPRDASIGSIGVIAAHEDLSEQLKMQGVNVELITSSAHKAEGNSLGPLSESDRVAMQARVDDLHGLFVRDVADGRRVAQKTVRSDFGQGRVLTAPEALQVGMIDRIATMSETLSRLAPREGIRGMAAGISTKREFESALRDAGWSRRDAMRIAAHGYNGASLRDAVGAEHDDDSERDARLERRDAVETGEDDQILALLRAENDSLKAETVLHSLKQRS